ncbi:hypothetical protein [Rhodopseudomonas sp.]|uniref:hypothetical protein n=1 Tax=Rhodopseudomonas sp. TaxID=1078 RepID=UPI0039E65001
MPSKDDKDDRNRMHEAGEKSLTVIVIGSSFTASAGSFIGLRRRLSARSAESEMLNFATLISNSETRLLKFESATSNFESEMRNCSGVEGNASALA